MCIFDSEKKTRWSRHRILSIHTHTGGITRVQCYIRYVRSVYVYTKAAACSEKSRWRRRMRRYISSSAYIYIYIYTDPNGYYKNVTLIKY